MRRLLYPLTTMAVGAVLGTGLAYGLYLVLSPVAFLFVPAAALVGLMALVSLEFVSVHWRE